MELGLNVKLNLTYNKLLAPFNCHEFRCSTFDLLRNDNLKNYTETLVQNKSLL